MARRISLKGKGADIFFGDYTPPGADVSERPAADPPAAESDRANQVSALPSDLGPDHDAAGDRSITDEAGASEQAPMLASKKASVQESK